MTAQGEKGGKVSRRTFLKAAGAGVAVAAAAGAGYYYMSTQPVGEKPPIKVGIMFPLTGVYSGNARKQLDGARLAVKEINDEGGLLGRPVQAFERDDELNPGVAVRRARELVESVGVEALIGCLGAQIVHVTNDYMKTTGKPYVASCIPVVETHKSGVRGPNTFFELPSTIQISFALADWSIENLGKKCYVIYADYAWGQEMFKYLKRRLDERGAEVVGTDPFPLGSTDFAPFLTRVLNSNPEVFAIGALGTDLINCLKQAAGFGMKEKMKILALNNTMTDTLAMGVDVFSGVYSFLDFYWQLEYPSTKKMLEKWWKAYNEPPDTYGIGAYNAVREWAAAVMRAGTTEGSAVTKELENHHYDWSKGEQWWRACDGQSIQECFVGRGKKPSDVKEKYDIFEIQGSEGGEEIMVSCSELGY